MTQTKPEVNSRFVQLTEPTVRPSFCIRQSHQCLLYHSFGLGPFEATNEIVPLEFQIFQFLTRKLNISTAASIKQALERFNISEAVSIDFLSIHIHNLRLPTSVVYNQTVLIVQIVARIVHLGSFASNVANKNDATRQAMFT